MISSISTLHHAIEGYNRAVTNGLRSLADPQPDGREPIRGIDEVDNSAGSNGGRGADRADRPVDGDSERERASHHDPPVDPATAAADIVTSRAEVRAAIALVHTEQENLGTLLDILA
jgi:hypothetical protein